VRRLTLAFILSNGAAVLLFCLFALYPAALIEEDEPPGPEMLASFLERDLAFQGKTGLMLRQESTALEFVREHPGAWLEVRGGGEPFRFGPVPPELARQDPSPRPVEARYRNLGATAALGDAITREIEVDGRKLIVSAGGVDSGALGFRHFLIYLWASDFFWIPVFTAIFNLAGILVAVPIVLRSVGPTARAAAALDPNDLSRRLPETKVVKELLPVVRAFNLALDRLAAGFEHRRRFIADVAHELRTPLAVITMHVEALPEGGRKPDLQRTVYRLGQMVGQMLDAERLALAARRREPVDIVALARAAVADIAPLAVANGYEIAFASEQDAVVVDGDGHAFARAITNLLGNAVAHGGGSGTLDVRVHADGRLDVSDQGPGIPVEARERIFEPFHRERWDRDGCGLGLHLVREIMQAHGGTARLLSAGPGAVFRLQFPAAHSA
jgi:signal transduction histidine kinase